MDQLPRPVPIADPESRPYWEAACQSKFMLPRCQNCGVFNFPPRARCPHCLSDELVWTELSGRGHLYSYCVVHQPSIPGFKVPYLVAQVELEEQRGLRLISNLLDCNPEDVSIGMPLEIAFEQINESCVLPQFRPPRNIKPA